MKTYYDIVGDGGSDILEQVSEQQSRIRDNLADVRRMLAIASGKGGVGKSTLTMQLAAAFKARGDRVAILDADLNGPTQARLGGVTEIPMIPGRQGLAAPRSPAGISVVSLGSLFPESRSVEFESVASGDSHTWRATKEFSVLGDLLATVEWGTLDWLLLDLPPGAERTFQYAEYLGAQAAFVLVTIPSDLARGVVARSVASLGEAGARILGCVENMKGYYCPGCDTLQPLFPETGAVELGVPALGSVPFDPELSAICDRGETFPIDDERPTWRAIREVAARIQEAWEKP